MEVILGYLVPTSLPGRWQGHLPLNALLVQGGQLRHGLQFVFAECCASVVSLCGPGLLCALTFRERYLLQDLVTSADVQGRLSSHWTQACCASGDQSLSLLAWDLSIQDMC